MHRFHEEMRRARATSAQGSADATVYGEICRRIGLPNAVVGIVEGEISVPDRELPLGRFFPPALLPLWSISSGVIVGYWKHWFCPSREVTVVEHFGETIFGKRDMTFEVGRNLEQYLLLTFLDDVIVKEGIDEDLRHFLSRVGFEQWQLLEELAEGSMTLSSVIERPLFKGNAPLKILMELKVIEEYTGYFPSERSVISKELMRNWCMYEVHSGFKRGQIDPSFRDRVSSSSDAPPWLSSNEQLPVFDRLISEGDLLGAWMSLNSFGWRIVDARAAILRLAEKAKDNDFTLLADAWCSIHFDESAY